MSPENVETRVVRLETRDDEKRAQIDKLLPLPAQHAVLEERLANFRKDLNDGMKSIRDELVEIKNEQANRAKERRTMLIALLVAGVGLIGTFAAQLLQNGHHP